MLFIETTVTGNCILLTFLFEQKCNITHISFYIFACASIVNVAIANVCSDLIHCVCSFKINDTSKPVSLKRTVVKLSLYFDRENFFNDNIFIHHVYLSV